MVAKEEVEELMDKYYEKNSKKGRNINIPEKLYRDYHKLCIDRGRSMSKEIRFFMAKELLESGKYS